MKYRISYIKKGRKYDFIIVFRNKEHKNNKIKQYKKDSINFRINKI